MYTTFLSTCKNVFFYQIWPAFADTLFTTGALHLPLLLFSFAMERPSLAHLTRVATSPPRSTQGTPITGVQSRNGISGKGRLLFQTFLFLAIVMNRKSQNWHMCVLHSTNNQVLWVDKDGVSLTTATFHGVKCI